MKWNLLWLSLALLALPLGSEEVRPRARDLGLHFGNYPSGPYNAITDVAGVKVGHCTVHFGEGPLKPGAGPARTGVTAILPVSDPWGWRLPAAAFVLNGNGEMTGLAYVQDIGLLESPILLTNTLNVGKVCDAAVSWLVEKHPEIGVTDDVPIPVVAECDDSTLNDIQGRHVGEAQVRQALQGADSGPVREGCVGAGTGMIAFGFKSGIGTSSRVLPADQGAYRVGILVNDNHGIREELRIDGLPVGQWMPEEPVARRTEGSIILVVATDAPLSASQLARLARRAAVGLARTGSSAHHGSGDLVIAFSTANGRARSQSGVLKSESLADSQLDGLYQATVEATEESIINALLAAQTTKGRDAVVAPALPVERLREILSGRKR